MAARNAIVLIAGELKELPSGDTLNGATGGGGTSSVTTSVSGVAVSPYTGTMRRYFTASRSFTGISVGVSTTPATTATITLKKNGMSVATITLSSVQTTNTGTIAVSVVTGDYFTVDVSGSNVTDLFMELS